MHQTALNILSILNDGWQNIALSILLADRAVSRRRTRRRLAAVEAAR